MPHLIDSDWLIDYLGNGPLAVSLINRLIDDGVAISIITYIEICQGVERSAEETAGRQRLQELTEFVPILPITLATAERCARLREWLRRQGRRVNQRAMDLIIAATALEYGMVLLTRNTRDYDDIPDLQLYQQS